MVVFLSCCKFHCFPSLRDYSCPCGAPAQEEPIDMQLLSKKIDALLNLRAAQGRIAPMLGRPTSRRSLQSAVPLPCHTSSGCTSLLVLNTLVSCVIQCHHWPRAYMNVALALVLSHSVVFGDCSLLKSCFEVWIVEVLD